MKNGTDHCEIFSQLPQETLEAIWLGALLTLHLAAEGYDEEAARILDALQTIRERTLVSAPPHGSARNIPNASKARNKAIVHPVDHEALRQALRFEQKLEIKYRDAKGRTTIRVVWPVDVGHFGPNGDMFCWCEKRRDFRHFRFDRVEQMTVLSQRTGAPRSVMASFAELITSHDYY